MEWPGRARGWAGESAKIRHPPAGCQPAAIGQKDATLCEVIAADPTARNQGGFSDDIRYRL